MKVQQMSLRWFCSTWLSDVNLHDTSGLQENTDHRVVMRSGWEDRWFKGSLRCLKSLLLLITGKTVDLWFFSEFNLLPFDKLLIIDSGIGGKDNKKLLKHLRKHLSSPFLRLHLSLTPPCPCSLSFSCFHWVALSLCQFFQWGDRSHQRLGLYACWCCWRSSSLSGWPLRLWAGQCHRSQWHRAIVLSGMHLFQLGSPVGLGYFSRWLGYLLWHGLAIGQSPLRHESPQAWSVYFCECVPIRVLSVFSVCFPKSSSSVSLYMFSNVFPREYLLAGLPAPRASSCRSLLNVFQQRHCAHPWFKFCRAG